MPVKRTDLASGITDPLAYYRELCALAVNALIEGDLDVAIAAAWAAVEVATAMQLDCQVADAELDDADLLAHDLLQPPPHPPEVCRSSRGRDRSSAITAAIAHLEVSREREATSAELARESGPGWL